MFTDTSNKVVTLGRAGADCYVTLKPLSSYAMRASAFGKPSDLVTKFLFVFGLDVRMVLAFSGILHSYHHLRFVQRRSSALTTQTARAPHWSTKLGCRLLHACCNLRSSLIVFTPVMVQDGAIGQSCMLSFIQVPYLAILASVRPWRAPVSNFVATMSWIGLALCFPMASVSTSVSESGARAGDIVALIVVFAMLVLLLHTCV